MRFNKYFGLSLFFQGDAALFVKIICTSTFICFISDLGFFCFRISGIRLFLYQRNLCLILSNCAQIYCIKKVLNNFIFNCCWGCFCYLFVKGIGFRIIAEGSNFLLRLGYSNLILVNPPVGIFFKFIDKYNFSLYSLNFNLLMCYCSFLRSLCTNNLYKQRGLYFKNEMLSLRIIRNKKVYF